MTQIFIAEEHSQLYDLWLERGDRNLTVCHIDFHCDMRGLLIDRRSGKARYVHQYHSSMNRLDSGSFLTYAVMNGIVTTLRWVHDDYGGREYDVVYGVKYEKDFTALPYRLWNSKKWVPLSYTEQTFTDWDGPRQGEHLSIDWDGIAYIDYDENHIRLLMDEVLGYRDLPEIVFIARSQEYSHPNQALFDEFVLRLEKKFNTKAMPLPFKKHPPMQLRMPWRLIYWIERGILRRLRRIGIY
jgi:hypothetical protein